MRLDIYLHHADESETLTLLRRIDKRIQVMATDPAKLEELANSLDNKGSALAAAVVANTPADPDTGTPEV